MGMRPRNDPEFTIGEVTQTSPSRLKWDATQGMHENHLHPQPHNHPFMR